MKRFLAILLLTGCASHVVTERKSTPAVTERSAIPPMQHTWVVYYGPVTVDTRPVRLYAYMQGSNVCLMATGGCAGCSYALRVSPALVPPQWRDVLVLTNGGTYVQPATNSFWFTLRLL